MSKHCNSTQLCRSPHYSVLFQAFSVINTHNIDSRPTKEIAEEISCASFFMDLTRRGEALFHYALTTPSTHIVSCLPSCRSDIIGEERDRSGQQQGKRDQLILFHVRLSNFFSASLYPNGFCASSYVLLVDL